MNAATPQSPLASLPPPRDLLQQLYAAAVGRALPSQVMPALLPELLALAPKPGEGRTLVLGAGKAGGAMAQSLEQLWPQDLTLSGLVITRYGHCPPDYRPKRIELVEAAHPVPDAAGQAASARLLALTEGLGPQDLVICLISGGGSALLSLPAPGLSLADKQQINRALLQCGASISEMNCVRKHLSAIKGGRLAAACAPARVHTLLISDVPGDDPSIIASGPTVADATSCADALAICQRYRIQLPSAALQGLRSGAFETPKPGDACFENQQLTLLATPQMSLQAAAEAARAMGLPAHILSDEIEGESRDIGRMHGALARAVARRGEPFAKPCVILSGGETTVTVAPGRKPGQGGRATEFLLGCALALATEQGGEPGVHVLAADTDGIDGVGENAGALLTPSSLARARALGLSAQTALDAHDALSFFAPLGDLVSPGPTFTNVNDFRALLIL
ncbi:glycerate kinase [Paucibacter sp. KBW04]|uniref:glycerate kinase type-2 family protein n=1 Tax=Paucibacter sp. KBW04 TaxID=2153361 RepID=UPI000F56F344|nr:glycerate kinase [Paucibacter sp. KBW04]RQO61916.1 glycerate kinase [Paucibacter sp. KBW04]